MKKLLLSFLVTVVPFCFAQNTNQSIDKVFLQEIKNDLINELKKVEDRFNYLASFGDAREVPSKIISEFLSNDIIKIYLENISTFIFFAIIDEQKSFEEAIQEFHQIDVNEQQEKEGKKLFLEMAEKYLDNDGLRQPHWYILKNYFVLFSAKIVMNNILQKIDAVL